MIHTQIASLVRFPSIWSVLTLKSTPINIKRKHQQHDFFSRSVHIHSSARKIFTSYCTCEIEIVPVLSILLKLHVHSSNLHITSPAHRTRTKLFKSLLGKLMFVPPKYCSCMQTHMKFKQHIYTVPFN